MKKAFLSGIIFILIIFFIISCEGGVEVIKNEPELLDYNYSGCINSFSTFSPETAIVDIRISGLRLKVIHKNAMLNCCPDTLLLTLISHNDTIILYEDDCINNRGDMGCDCMCEYIMEAEIKVPKYGKYILEIRSSYFPFLIFRKEINVVPPIIDTL